MNTDGTQPSQDVSNQNPTAPEIGTPNGNKAVSEWCEPITVTISGEVAYEIRKIAGYKNVKPSVVAKEFLTDGLVSAGILPKWWRRGKMVHI